VFLNRLGLTPEEMAAHAAAGEVDMEEFAAEYQRRQGERTHEEIEKEKAEARAVHGPGVELVNVFTGEHYIT
jgi:aminoglycoside phosphotransferase